jgi:RNA polymerase sigma-70 factor (ECF subfamily)
VQNLIKEYRETLRRIRKAKSKFLPAEKRSDEQVYEYRLLGEMERDLEWSLEWMTTGRQPGNRRGVERLAAYQRERPIDPIHFQRYVMQPLYKQEEHALSDEDMRRVKEALSVLSQLEREVYVMSRGKCLSYAEIAGLLGVAKGTVQKMIERAEKKMAKQKETSLFLVG